MMRYKKDMNVVKSFLLTTMYQIIDRLKTWKRILQNKRLPNDTQLDVIHDDISAVVVVKNEAKYIEEWIVYHSMIGVNHFYVYDNDSNDNLVQVLQPFIQEGLVTLKKLSGNSVQMIAYDDAIQRYGSRTEWMLWLDADEFIVLLDNQTLTEFLGQLDEKVHELLVGWMIYGSSNLVTQNEGLVIERFRKHATEDFIADYKPIFKPRYVIEKPKFPHWVYVSGRVIDETGRRLYGYPFHTRITAVPAPKQHIRINHYYSKSLQEFEAKRKRGYADHIQNKENIRNINDFNEHDRNEIEDPILDSFVKAVKLKIRAYRGEAK